MRMDFFMICNPRGASRFTEQLVFTRITLIGHSIGCRMLIDIVSRNTTHNFESRIQIFFFRNPMPSCECPEVYFLFPTIENMISSPKGVPTWSLCTTWRRPMLLLLLTILNLILPDFLLRFSCITSVLVRLFFADGFWAWACHRRQRCSSGLPQGGGTQTSKSSKFSPHSFDFLDVISTLQPEQLPHDGERRVGDCPWPRLSKAWHIAELGIHYPPPTLIHT